MITFYSKEMFEHCKKNNIEIVVLQAFNGSQCWFPVNGEFIPGHQYAHIDFTKTISEEVVDLLEQLLTKLDESEFVLIGETKRMIERLK